MKEVSIFAKVTLIFHSFAFQCDQIQFLHRLTCVYIAPLWSNGARNNNKWQWKLTSNEWKNSQQRAKTQLLIKQTMEISYSSQTKCGKSHFWWEESWVINWRKCSAAEHRAINQDMRVNEINADELLQIKSRKPYLEVSLSLTNLMTLRHQWALDNLLLYVWLF